MNKISYSLGLNIGRQLKEMGVKSDFCAGDFAAAVEDIVKGRAPQVSVDEANAILGTFFAELEQRRAAEAAERGRTAKVDGEKFLADNAKRQGVVVTASGLQYAILQEGSGRRPKATDTVRCHYQGTLIDGTVFDSSYQRKEPCDFGLNQVIAGWTEGVQLMKEGSKYRFFIPYQLAYGERGAGAAIPPCSALVFDVELLKVL